MHLICTFTINLNINLKQHHHKYTNERLAKTGKLPLERLQERQKQLANKKVQSIEVDNNNNNENLNQKPVNLETKDEGCYILCC